MTCASFPRRAYKLNRNLSLASTLSDGTEVHWSNACLKTFAVVRWSYLRVIINPQPTLLLHCGKFIHDAMRRQRVAEADVRAAIRQSGFDRVEDVGAVILEADGTFSVIKQLGPDASALAD